MLKHVQSSPHRNLSSSSLKKPFEGSPKHLRQVSSPALLFVSRPSSSPSGSECSWPPSSSTSSSCCRSDTSSSNFKESDDDSFELLSSINKFDRSAAAKRNSIADSGSTGSSDQISHICPNCLKKKKSFLSSCTPNSSVVGRSQNSCANLNDSLKCISVKNGNSCMCSREYLKRFQKCVTIQYHNNNGTIINIPQSRMSSPSHDRLALLEVDETEASPSRSSSSESSSTSSSIYSKSPPCSLRGKTRLRKHNNEKLHYCRQDNLSLDSSMSCSITSQEDQQMVSMSSSAVSLQDNIKQSTVRIWVRCLLQEMEYKTLSVSYSTTCRQVVGQLLSKFRMKHRDPNLFYLAMEVTIRKAGAEVRQCLRLDDSAYPAQLVECHPKEDSRLALRMRRGGLLRVYDEALSQGSHYKSLLVGEKTCCSEVVALVLACNKVIGNINEYSLYEVWPVGKQERVLHHVEEPMVIAGLWPDKESVRFEIRKLSKADVESLNALKNVISDTESSTTSPARDRAKWRDKIGFRNFEKVLPETSDDSSSGIASSISSSSSPCPPEEQRTNDISPSNRSLPRIKPKRKLPKPPSNRDLIETSVDEMNQEPSNDDDLDPNHPAHEFKTYNDYENYFYI